MNEPKRIDYDSEQAAKRVTLTGWLGADGHFWPDSAQNAEHMARYSGCTHHKCKCGESYDKRFYCDACKVRDRRARYEAMPIHEWDGKCMLATLDDDRFWTDFDEFFEWCDDNETDPETVLLVGTDPRGLREIDEDDWADALPEDADLGDVAPGVELALRELNKAIERAGTVSWWPADFRVAIPAREAVDDE